MKTGIYTASKAILKACEVYQKYSPAFIAFVNASTLSDAEKTEVLNLMTVATGLCGVLRKLLQLA